MLTTFGRSASLAAMLFLIGATTQTTSTSSDECSDCTPFRLVTPVVVKRYQSPKDFPFTQMIAGKAGTIWFAAAGNRIGKIANGAYVDEPASDVAGQLTLGGDGIWFARNDGGIGVYSTGKAIRRIPPQLNARKCRVSELTLDGQGNPWSITQCVDGSGNPIGYVASYDRLRGEVLARKEIPAEKDDAGKLLATEVRFQHAAFLYGGDGIAAVGSDTALIATSPLISEVVDRGIAWLAYPNEVEDLSDGKSALFYNGPHDYGKHPKALPIAADGTGGVFVRRDDRLCRLSETDNLFCAPMPGLGDPIAAGDETFYAIEEGGQAILRFRFDEQTNAPLINPGR